LRNILLKYQDAVVEWSGRLGLFTDYPADLPTTDDAPMVGAPFRVGELKREAFRTVVEEYRVRQYIEQADSPYSAAAFLVTRKAQTGAAQRYRLVEDYRPLNTKLLDIPYPVPSVQELLDAIGHGPVYFALLDMPNGYHHVPLTTDARTKTAFQTPEGQFQYRVLPFGLKTAPRIFQQTLERILSKHIRKSCLIYLDDIIIFGNSVPQLLENIDAVLADFTRPGARSA
jgi:hypothetical protein